MELNEIKDTSAKTLAFKVDFFNSTSFGDSSNTTLLDKSQEQWWKCIARSKQQTFMKQHIL